MRTTFALSSLALASQVTPIQKVITLLEGMHKTAIEEKNAEEVVIGKFTQKCKDDKVVQSKMIEDTEDEIDQLTGGIDKADADINKLASEIAYESQEKAYREQDQRAASHVRGFEKQDYDATADDYSESLSALDKAIAVLKERTVTTEVSSELQMSLLQTKSQRTAVTNVLQEFLQQAPTQGTTYAYESQTGGVIQILEELKDKFVSEKNSLDKAERLAKHAYEELMETRQGEIDTYTSSLARKNKRKGQREADKAAAEGAKADAMAKRDADKQELNDQMNNCKLNQETYARQQELRTGEMQAIEQAIEIMSSDKVSASGDKHLMGEVVEPSAEAKQGVEYDLATNNGVAFLQVASNLLRSRMKADVVPDSALKILMDAASQYKSERLSMLATKIAANPLKKVTEMIRSMINQLTQEATQEADQHGYCQAQLGANKIERETKEEEVADLTATRDALNAEIADLADSIAKLEEEIAYLSQDRETVKNERAADKKANLQTIADAKAAQAAVADALNILREFYGSAAEQSSAEDQSALDSKGRDGTAQVYGGQQGEAGGVLGMLEVVQSDFARLEADTTSAEESESARYTKFMNSSEVDKEVKKTERDHKKEVKGKREDSLQSTSDELATTQEELKAANKVYADLKPVCVDTGMTYEERVEKRAGEIQSLKEVLEVLKANESGAI